MDALVGWFVAPFLLLLLHERGDRIAKWIISLSVRAIDEDVRERYAAELLADSEGVEGNAWKIYHAFGVAIRYGVGGIIAQLTVRRQISAALIIAMWPTIIASRMLVKLFGAHSVVGRAIRDLGLLMTADDVVRGVDSVRDARELIVILRSELLRNGRRKDSASGERDDTSPEDR